jgi:hypothetical protein
MGKVLPMPFKISVGCASQTQPTNQMLGVLRRPNLQNQQYHSIKTKGLPFTDIRSTSALLIRRLQRIDVFSKIWLRTAIDSVNLQLCVNQHQVPKKKHVTVVIKHDGRK